jgi:hypothetical protein
VNAAEGHVIATSLKRLVAKSRSSNVWNQPAEIRVADKRAPVSMVIGGVQPSMDVYRRVKVIGTSLPAKRMSSDGSVANPPHADVHGI